MVTENFGPRVFAYPGARDWWAHGNKAGFAKSTQEWADMMFKKNAEIPGFWDYSSSELPKRNPEEAR
jgi:hypothetical protein